MTPTFRFFQKFIVGCCVLLCLGFAGCASRSAKARKASAREMQPPPVSRETTPVQGSRDYKILPADTLEITVFQEPDLKSTLRVSNEGTIAFPLVGVVQVGGLTPQGAAQALRDRLSKGFLVNPQVT